MALLGNGYSRDSTSGKLFGGTSTNGTNPSLFRWLRPADLRNQFAGEGITSDIASVPSGGRHPVVWIMPQKAGAIASRYEADFALSASGSGAMGLNADGSASFTISFAPAAGDLVVSGAGTASFTITTTANAVATLNGTGSAEMVFTATALKSALAWGESLASFSITGSLTPYATGSMIGSTEFGGELTENSIATAVWAKVIEAGYTGEQIMRLLAAHAAGSATGLEGADPQFVGLDGSTVRINGTYSAGTRTIDALDAE